MEKKNAVAGKNKAMDDAEKTKPAVNSKRSSKPKVAKAGVKKAMPAKTVKDKKTEKDKPALVLTEKLLVAKGDDPSSKPADMKVTFSSGVGQLTASLFRNGLPINSQTISSSANIHFSDVQQGDSISVNGVCTGNAKIEIDVDTDPDTPTNFSAQPIHIFYDVL